MPGSSPRAATAPCGAQSLAARWSASNDQRVWVTFRPGRHTYGDFLDLCEHQSREDAIRRARDFQQHYGTLRRARREIVDFGEPEPVARAERDRPK